MAKKGVFVGMLAMVLVFALVLSSVSCGTTSVSARRVDSTSFNWVMEPAASAPALNTLEKLSSSNAEALDIFQHTERAESEREKWYMLTAKEKPGEIYYFYQTAGTVSVWTVYKKK
jgi:hypothetical protein